MLSQKTLLLSLSPKIKSIPASGSWKPVYRKNNYSQNPTGLSEEQLFSESTPSLSSSLIVNKILDDPYSACHFKTSSIAVVSTLCCGGEALRGGSGGG
jgi:hypothetical protein